MKRLYNATCAWLEASAKAMSEEVEPEPEGAGAAQVEHAHSFSTTPEMHATSNYPMGFSKTERPK